MSSIYSCWTAYMLQEETEAGYGRISGYIAVINTILPTMLKSKLHVLLQQHYSQYSNNLFSIFQSPFYYLRQEVYVFGLVCLFVCYLFDCQQDYIKNYWMNETWWKGIALAKQEPITFWTVSESQGTYTNYVSLSLTLRDRTFVLHLCSFISIYASWTSGP